VLRLDPHARPARTASRKRSSWPKAQIAKLALGDPFDPKTQARAAGVRRRQRDTVLGYIEKGKRRAPSSCRRRPAAGADQRATTCEPTIFANVDNGMTIAQEEIFGPVLSIIAYDTEDDAVRIANDSIYGLAGGVWGGSQERALGVARRIRTGQVDVNGGRFNHLAPFGGYKKSGIGRELGPHALDEFFQLKAIQR
jgi:aldehyde dehydrogenase (NAD+)